MAQRRSTRRRAPRKAKMLSMATAKKAGLFVGGVLGTLLLVNTVARKSRTVQNLNTTVQRGLPI